MTAVLDGHVHLWDRARHPQAWIDPIAMAPIDRDFGAADLAAMLTATGSDAAVLVQSTNSLAETADLLALAAHAPVAAVVGWLDLTGDVAAQAAVLRDGEGGVLLRGVRHLAHLDPDPAWLDRPDVRRGLEALPGLGITVDLVVRSEQLPLAAEVVRDHPAVRFVLDHLGNPPFGGLDEWRRALHSVGAQPNAMAKLSGLITGVGEGWIVDDLLPVVDAAFGAFGPDRLLYGSDWPVVELAEGGAVAWADATRAIVGTLSSSERDAVLGGTCARVYGVRA